jgi:hypothetical protein
MAEQNAPTESEWAQQMRNLPPEAKYSELPPDLANKAVTNASNVLEQSLAGLGEFMEKLARFCITANSGGIAISFAVAAVLIELKVSIAWLLWAIFLFSVGLILSGLYYLRALHRNNQGYIGDAKLCRELFENEISVEAYGKRVFERAQPEGPPVGVWALYASFTLFILGVWFGLTGLAVIQFAGST